MREIELRLRPQQVTRRPNDAAAERLAWFLRDRNPETWVREICRLDSSQRDLRLLMIPTSRQDLTPCGVLVVGGPDRKPPAQWRPFRVLSERVFVPLDAGFHPVISDEERESLFDADYKYVWLPESGLTKFDPKYELRLSDLLTLGSQPDLDVWSQALPGVSFPKRLISIQRAAVEQLDDWLQEGGDDIGADAKDISNLPPATNEPSGSGVSQAMRYLAMKSAKGVGGIADAFRGLIGSGVARPTTGLTAGSGFWDKVKQWSERQVRHAQENLQAAREQQLNRLMSMLDSDPDKGLRFAIPFSEDMFRGLSNVGSSLSESAVDFNWGNLFGGSGRASFWDMSDQSRQRLRAKYLELANREQQLGRYRRAAYIHAHLLGDLVAAAAALRAGRFYREAAALYQKKLNRKNLAAECLAEGQFYDEAIKLYVELNEYMKAGDLAERAGDHNRAIDFFEQAVLEARDRNDFQAAANICRVQLKDVDRGLDNLQAGWPYSKDAAKCLATEFDWLAELGRSESAIQRIEDLEASQLSGRQAVQLVQQLSSLSTKSPDAKVGARSGEACLFVVSRQLTNYPSVDDGNLLGSLSSMYPEDRLLERDCFRYCDSKTKLESSVRKPVSNHQPQVKHEFQLVLSPQWWTAIVVDQTIVALGTDGREASICQASFDGERIERPFRSHHQLEHLLRIVLSPVPRSSNEIICAIGHEPLSATGVATSLKIDNSWLRDVALATAVCGEDFWSVHSDGVGTLLLEANRRTGPYLSRTISVSPPEQESAIPPQLHARSQQVFLTWGHELIVQGHPSEQRMELPFAATGICGSIPNSVPRVVVSFTEGVMLVWRDNDFENIRLATGVIVPVAEFTASGHLVVAGRNRLEIYVTSNRQSDLRYSQEYATEQEPIAVLKGTSPREFAVVDSDGTVRVWEIPRVL